MSYALTTIGLVGLERGDLDQGIQALEEGIVYGEQANFYATQVSHRLIIAWMHLTLGDKEGAKTIWEQVPEWDNFWIGSNMLREVLWHTYAGEPELARQALAEFEKSLNMAELTMYFGPVVYDFTMEVLLLNGEYDAGAGKNQ